MRDASRRIVARLQYWSDVAFSVGSEDTIDVDDFWVTRGFLKKQGSRNVYSWKTRYHVLQGTTIRYYLSKDDFVQGRSPKGQMRVYGVRAVSQPEEARGVKRRTDSGRGLIAKEEDGAMYAFECDVIDRSRPLFVAYASDSQTRDAWVRALERALRSEERIVVEDDGSVTEEWFWVEKRTAMGWAKHGEADYLVDAEHHVQRRCFSQRTPDGWAWIPHSDQPEEAWELVTSFQVGSCDDDGWVYAATESDFMAGVTSDTDSRAMHFRRRRFSRRRRRCAGGPMAVRPSSSAARRFVSSGANRQTSMPVQELLGLVASSDALQATAGRELDVLAALADLASLENLHETMYHAIEHLASDAVRACDPSLAFAALLTDVRKPLAGNPKFQVVILKAVCELLSRELRASGADSSPTHFNQLWTRRPALWTDFIVWHVHQSAASAPSHDKRVGRGSPPSVGGEKRLKEEEELPRLWVEVDAKAQKVKDAFLRQAKRVVDGALAPTYIQGLLRHSHYSKLINAYGSLHLRISCTGGGSREGKNVFNEAVEEWLALRGKDVDGLDELIAKQQTVLEAARLCIGTLEEICLDLLFGEPLYYAVQGIVAAWGEMGFCDVLHVLHIPVLRFSVFADGKFLDSTADWPMPPAEVHSISGLHGERRHADAATGSASANGEWKQSHAESEEAFSDSEYKIGEAKLSEAKLGEAELEEAKLDEAKLDDAVAVNGKAGAYPSLSGSVDKTAGVSTAKALTTGTSPKASATIATPMDEPGLQNGSVGLRPNLAPLPIAFIHARDWLMRVKQTELFQIIWRDLSGTEMPTKLYLAANAWEGIYVELVEGNFTAARARAILSTIGSKEKIERELAVLGQTWKHPTAAEEPRVWVIDEAADQEWISPCLEQILLFEKLVAIADRLDTILRDEFKRFMDAFLNEEARGQRDSIWSLFVEMKARYREDMTLKEISHLDLGTSVSGSADMLLELPLDFLNMLCGATDLLIWMQSSYNLHTDEDYAHSLEVCRGKGELERPDELVDGDAMESKLGALSIVRNAFHQFLFREEDLFMDVTELLNVLVSCSKVLRVRDVSSAVEQCTQVLRAFIEIFDDDSDTVAPNRLRAFHDPSRKTRWEVFNQGDNTEAPLDSFLTLQYDLRRGGTTTVVRQSVNDLMDFQSILVLASTRSGDEVVQRMVDDFTSQFEWLRRMNEIMHQLHVEGHPAYREYRYSFPLKSASKELRAQVKSLTAMAESWRRRVSCLRRKYYFVNMVSMNVIWEMIGMLKDLGSRRHSEGAKSSIKEFFSLFGYGIDVVKAGELWMSIVGTGEAPLFVDDSADVIDELEQFAQWITGVLDGEARPERLVSPDTATRVHETNTSEMKHGLNIITFEEQDKMMDCLLSLYGQAGRLPEREELYMCNRQGNRLEDVQNLVLRWAGARDHGRGDGLYVISAVEFLSFEQQRTLASVIQGILFEEDARVAVASAAKGGRGEEKTEEDIKGEGDLDDDEMGYDDGGVGEAKGEDPPDAGGRTEGAKSSAEGSHSGDMMAKLVLLVGGSRSQVLVEQFQQHRRVNFNPVPPEVIQEVTEEVSSTTRRVVQVYKSERGGAGKTFRVLTDAQADDRTVITIPVHKNMRADAVVKHVRELLPTAHRRSSGPVPAGPARGQFPTQGELFPTSVFASKKARFTLHFSLSATTPRSFDTILAELVLFAGVLDTATGSLFAWSGAAGEVDFDNHIAIEVANTGKGHHKLPRICDLLPSKDIFVGPSTLCVSREALQSGFVGFDSPRGDGTIEENRSSPTANNAYVRLQTVCKALQIAAAQEGFPPDFQANRLADVSSEECFELLTSKMGLPREVAPNMHQIWNFVNILFWQLMDLHHESSIANSVAVSETLDRGCQNSSIKGELLRILIKTANDISNPGHTLGADGELKVTPWQSSNHEFVCFQISGRRGVGEHGGGLSFLSIDPELMRQGMDPRFVAELQRYGISIGEDLNSLHKRHSQVLNIITGNRRTEEECAQLLGGHYCMTGDSVLKMLAVFIRIRCGIPVVLMGECGCGKTELIRYTCAYLGASLIILDCHGGTEEEDLIAVFDRANRMAEARFGDGMYPAEEQQFPEEVPTGGPVEEGGRVQVVGIAEYAGQKGVVSCFDQENADVVYITLDRSEEIIIAMTSQVRALKLAVPDPPDLVRTRSLGKGDVYVFLDEINTCAHMGLITEVIMNHSLYGKPLHCGIRVLAALNPYRVHSKTDAETTGLVFQRAADEGDLAADPMSRLVYRVHPIPEALLSYIYDYGALKRPVEHLYIHSMARRQLPLVNPENLRVLGSLLLESQHFIRSKEGEESAVSLRDVRRALELIMYFDRINGNVRNGVDLNADLRWGAESRRSVVLGLAMVYYYRLRQREDRLEYCAMLEELGDGLGMRNGEVLRCIEEEQDKYSSFIEFEEGIARNEALKENLFVAITCIANLIPVFIVGKPGSSKTLTMQVIQSNLQGDRSKNSFWRDFPAVNIFPYQCSPLSTAHGIRVQYEKASAFQDNQGGRHHTTILLLDEVGLAEHSPDLPLKVLHKILVERHISVVGLSNWVLDPAKMNRAILLNRPDPTQDDLRFTGQAISGLEHERDGLNLRLLNTLARAYYSVYSVQEGRDFIGMRDYYHLLKFLRNEIKAGRRLDSRLLIHGLSRNFNGKPEVFSRVMQIFEAECRAHVRRWNVEDRPTSRELIGMNLRDKGARHLMLITVNGAALPVMFGCGLVNHESAEVLVGSQFPDDQSELALVQAINKVKNAMSVGRTVVLMQHENIYEALYDVLNQRYVLKRQRDGSQRRMLRLAVGAHSQLCPCHDDFKVVVIVEREDAYERLDLPLLNRFEKQVFGAEEVVSTAQRVALRALQKWVQKVAAECHSDLSIFNGFHASSLPSLVLTSTNYSDGALHGLSQIEGYVRGGTPMPESLQRVARALAEVSTPLAHWRSSSLREVLPNYFEKHGSFANLIAQILGNPEQNVKFPEPEAKGRPGPLLDCLGITISSVRTFSPVTHLDAALAEISQKDELQGALVHDVLHLASFSSERDIVERLRLVFFSEKLLDPSILVIQCDSQASSPSLINHVRLICEQLREERAKWPKNRVAHLMERLLTRYHDRPEVLQSYFVPVFPVHVFILVHVSPSFRSRSLPLDFHSGIREYFVDDLRPEGTNIGGSRVLTTKQMLERSTYELTSDFGVSVADLVRTSFRAALSFVLVPLVESRHDDRLYVSWYPARIQMMISLLSHERFMQLFSAGVVYILRAQHTRGNASLSSLLSTLCGSLRQTLEELISDEIKRAASLLLAHLDRNFHLNLLWGSLFEIPPEYWSAAGEAAASTVGSASAEPASRAAARKSSKAELWFRMLEEHSAGVWSQRALEGLSTTLQVVGTASAGSSSLLKSINVVNDGRHGFLVSRFPYSSSFVRFMDSRETKEDIMRAATENAGSEVSDVTLSDRLRAYTGARFGPAVVEAWKEWDVQDYLHDYVAIAAPQYPGLDLSMLITVYRCVVCRSMPNAFESPAHVHIAGWHSEERLFALCSLLSSSGLRDSLRASVRDLMISMTVPPPSSLPATCAAHSRMVELECLRTVLKGLLDAYQSGSRTRSATSLSAEVMQWASEVATLQSALGPQIQILQAQAAERGASVPTHQRDAIRHIVQLYHGVQILKIFTREILVAGLSDSVEDHSRSQVVQGIRIELGMHGHFRYKNRSKRDYPGQILQIHRDGTFDILYDDGDAETRASIWQYRLPKRTRVIADYNGSGVMMAGTIQKLRYHGCYDVHYDGGYYEQGVERFQLRLETPELEEEEEDGLQQIIGTALKSHSAAEFLSQVIDGDARSCDVRRQSFVTKVLQHAVNVAMEIVRSPWVRDLMAGLGHALDTEVQLRAQRFLKEVLLQLSLPSIFPPNQNGGEHERPPEARELDEMILNILVGHESFCGHHLQETKALGEPREFLRRSVLQFLIARGNAATEALAFRKVDELVRGVVNSKSEAGGDQDVECSICLGEFVNPHVTACNHVFCKDCIEDWLATDPEDSCPLCRTPTYLDGPFEIQQAKFIGVQVIQLMIQLESDLRVELLPPDFDLDVTSALQITEMTISDAVNTFRLKRCVEILSRMQVQMRRYAGALTKAHMASEPLPRPPRFLEALPSGADFYWIRVFLLRLLVNSMGEQQIMMLASRSDAPRWLTSFEERLRLALNGDRVPVLDMSYGHELAARYNAVHAAVRTSMQGNGLVALEAECANSHGLRSLVLLAISRLRVQAICGTAEGPQNLSSPDLWRWMSGTTVLGGNRCPLWQQNPAQVVRSAATHEVLLFGLFLNGPFDLRAGRCVAAMRPDSSLFDLHILQVASHVASTALHIPNGWLHRLAFDPRSQQQSFMPTMPVDETTAVISALDRSAQGARRGYRCQCGAIYFIGNCGQAWVRGTCPECGHVIGGEDHQLERGNRAINEDDLLMGDNKKGYCKNVVGGLTNQLIGRENITQVTIRVLRFLMHTMLSISAGLGRRYAAQVRDLLNCNVARPQAVPNADAAADFLFEKAREDWQALKTALNVNDEELSVFFELLLKRYREQPDTHGQPLHETMEARVAWESKFQEVVVEPLVERVTDLVEQEMKAVEGRMGRAYGGTNLRAEGATLKDELLERAEDPPPESVIWRFRKQIAFDDFCERFYRISDNVKEFPIIDIVIREEAQLSVIRHLPAILQWHAVLFEVYPDGALSRQDAMNLTNEDALDAVPKERRKAAERVFESFCDAFNASFRFLENLYECNVNPYRDLVMDLSTPLIFSLPSRHAQGSQSAEGMATVALADMLAARHNEVLSKVVSSSDKRVGTKDKEASALQANKLLALAEVPPTTHLTSPDLLRLWLCVYERVEHMLPLLYQCARQPLHLGCGRDIAYDMKQISSELSELLLTGKQPVNLHLRIYQYQGEILRSGQLSRLENRVPQAELPEQVLTAIREELQSIHASRQLLSLLETSISFLSSGAGSNANMELAEFVTQVLLVESKTWANLSTPTLRSPQVRLFNLKSLYLCIADALSDEDPLEKVEAKYKEPLNMDGEEVRQLMRAARARLFDVEYTAGQLRTVLVEQLSEGALSAEIFLHDANAEGFLDFRFEYGGAEAPQGFEAHFPVGLRLKHTFAVYELLCQVLEREKEAVARPQEKKKIGGFFGLTKGKRTSRR
uniref:Uncharacterized protein n=1 Tax=Pinguiococcus pyrenoidosus TaxID=172671 RepID=A0A7R9YCP3_9STRA